MTTRARDHGLVPAPGRTGPHNAITDVPGVLVGHTTILRPPAIHSGVTAIVPEGIGPDSTVAAGLHVGNGYGKLIGSTQLAELGVLESPIVLTSTLSAFRAADALVTWMLAQPAHSAVVSFNPFVGECNDGFLSDGRSRPVGEADVLAAIGEAAGGPVAEGSVGAGTGTGALGYKAGIGTASRLVDLPGGEVTLGVLVQANFGGTLRVGGVTAGHAELGLADPNAPEAGSCMIIAATDAPLDARQLTRLARRLVFGLGRTGADYSHGSGDYGVAFSTASGAAPSDQGLSPLFAAALDAVEESVLNSLVAARTTVGFQGRTLPGIPVDRLRALVLR
ncbi:P1 family peptidase [Phytomonospora sp. NPDC050363]|uniref:P1 family peptidase n=1 Tax=Phytomonospora sp. NPDC050363 TaxID=3155642 RepID=UPI0033C75B4E